MIARTDEMKLSSAGLLLLLAAVVMTLFSDAGSSTSNEAKANVMYRGLAE
ncbi:hypothetical protein [Roseibium album]|uniref:Uncharacterized protein n=1 Tax=Roseibium album TaxID=311410 RepID=A0A0M6ZG54_9HYPH|nr:hypothetical protein [Roseibium album]CTQ61739.1 hypothetical protein LA5094_04520 [Roseibium album]CTQ75417.1 hypothetical protein LA5096_04368 [Roseibium album]CTQ78421.1 hypothetical protein LA5095_04335 [Roseibium album]